MNIQSKKIVQSHKPYVSARDLYQSGIFLDANEFPEQWVKIDWSRIPSLNRYPTSSYISLRTKIADVIFSGEVSAENIFVSCGSDQIITFLMQAYIENEDSVMVMDPTFGMFQTIAELNEISVKRIPLKPDFNLDIPAIRQQLENVKMIIICSPNNPTGNLVSKEEIDTILSFFKGIVVIDEAYIDFCNDTDSFWRYIHNNEQILVMRTFSKAWGLAGVRIGYLVGQEKLIQPLFKAKEPYHIPIPSQEIGMQALDQIDTLHIQVSTLLKRKVELEEELISLGANIIETETNFMLVKIQNATKIQQELAERGIIVRDRSNTMYLDNVLRISVGTGKENNYLVNTVKQLIV